ncbi:MAG: aminotransferase, partial [Clostridia bacterium]|nr:aminotransferase [Clostridia bacterium]
MKYVTEYSKQELNDMLKELTIQFQEAKKLNLKLNMARGKPAAAQLDMNMGLLEFPKGCALEDGTDARNYGVLEGIPECRRLFGRHLGLEPERIFIGG